MSRGFERVHFDWFMDKAHRRTGWGDITWFSDGTKHYGTFSVSDDPLLGLPVEYRININESRHEPTFLLKLNNAHAARIDVNGRHKFDGERTARQSTHFQSNSRGSEDKETTVEIDVPPFPALTKGVNVNYEEELQRCFRASVELLNVDVSSVVWTPLPIGGGK